MSNPNSPYYKAKKRCLEYLGGKCVVCGTTEKLHFHHIVPADKKFNIALNCQRAWHIVQPELDKCELRCVKHHVEQHMRLDGWGGPRYNDHMAANLHYIRAAIEDRTGHFLTLEETRNILVEEGLLTPKQAENLIFNGYKALYSVEPSKAQNIEEALYNLIEDEEETLFDDPEDTIASDDTDEEPSNILLEI